MPERRTVPLLQRLCLEKVAEDMQGIWVKKHVPSSKGPFSELPACLVQDLLQLLGERQQLTSAALRLLLVPQLEVLDLRSCPRVVKKAVAEMITVRCTILVSLDLRCCYGILAGALADLIKALPRLTKLNLSATTCNTKVLSAVGSCSRRLRELDVSFCKGLTRDSLIHLAYDPTRGSFCCPELQVLMASGLKPRTPTHAVLRPVVFVLLALPSLTWFDHDFATEAVCLIYRQQFDNAQVAPKFPSLEDLVRRRMSTEVGEASGASRLTLPLKIMHCVKYSFLPMVCAVCPYLADVSVDLRDEPNLGQSFMPWRHLTHLAIFSFGRNVRELLPVAACLRAQLQTFMFNYFCYKDVWSIPALLSHCLNLRRFSGSLLSPSNSRNGQETPVEDLEWGHSPTHPEFPHLWNFCLTYSDCNRLPIGHMEVLRASVVYLLKHSPCLETMHLDGLPFSLDEVFEEVLEPRGTALVHLRELSLRQMHVSPRTIDLLLTTDNQLRLLKFSDCFPIRWEDYCDILERVSSEGFALQIEWE